MWAAIFSFAIVQGFPTRMVYLYNGIESRYTILARNPQIALSVLVEDTYLIKIMMTRMRTCSCNEYGQVCYVGMGSLVSMLVDVYLYM